MPARADSAGVSKSLLSFLIAVLVLAGGPNRGQAVPAPARAIRVAGKDYVRLTDWARANEVEFAWLKRDEILQLSNRNAKFQIAVDSREAQVNGVHVWLLFHPVTRDGAVYLAQIDLKSTLQPMFFPPLSRRTPGIRTICLDPGHGGKDPGFCVGSALEKRRSTNQEKTYNLLLAEEVARQLNRAGFRVSLTRSSDTFIELPTRSEIARRRGADLFVSLHFNATGTSQNSVQGAEVYCMTPAGAPSTNARGEGSGAGSFPGNRYNDKNLALACQIQKALTAELGVEDRGVHRGRLAVLRDATMPAVLVEAGFLSHPVEGRKIFTAAYRRKMASAIVAGIQAYKRATEQES